MTVRVVVTLEEKGGEGDTEVGGAEVAGGLSVAIAYQGDRSTQGTGVVLRPGSGGLGGLGGSSKDKTDKESPEAKGAGGIKEKRMKFGRLSEQKKRVAWRQKQRKLACMRPFLSLLLAGVWTWIQVKPTQVWAASSERIERTQEEWNELFEEARIDESEGLWEAALEKFRLLAKAKNSPIFHYHVALCEENAGRLVEALLDYKSTKTKAYEAMKDLTATARNSTSAAEEKGSSPAQPDRKTLEQVISLCQKAIERLTRQIANLGIAIPSGVKALIGNLEGNALTTDSFKTLTPLVQNLPGLARLEPLEKKLETFLPPLTLEKAGGTAQQIQENSASSGDLFSLPSLEAFVPVGGLLALPSSQGPERAEVPSHQKSVSQPRTSKPSLSTKQLTENTNPVEKHSVEVRGISSL